MNAHRRRRERSKEILPQRPIRFDNKRKNSLPATDIILCFNAF